MASKSCQDAEEAQEEMPSSLVDREPVSGNLGPPAGAPPDPTAPTRPQHTKPRSTPVFSSNRQSAPEFLDPRTLRLLWGQRELEIQALRWAMQGGREGRHCYILQEVAGIPPERSYHAQERLLQSKVQKLTLELKEQREQAQLEKDHLEERLAQATSTLQQLEAELQALQKSCLLNLAHSSWVGRTLRSQTGSVEVVTAETLMEPSDSSELLSPAVREGFRLENVDWNSIAHRYPNLFTNVEPNLENKCPPINGATSRDATTCPGGARCSRSMPQDAWSLESPHEHVGRQHKSVEWSSLPVGDTSSSEGTESEPPSSQPAELSPVQKVTGHPPWGPHDSSSDQGKAQTRTLSADAVARAKGCPSRDRCEPQAEEPCGTVLAPEPSADPESLRYTLGESSSLRIVAVSRREKFVRVLNQSAEETADLGGFVLQQLVRGFPACMYRFPPGTLLPPRHHVTVWGEGTGHTRKHGASLGRESVRFHSSRGCVTLLLSPKGEVLSEHRAPHCVTPVSRIFADNTDLSIDRFPLSEARPGADSGEQRCRPRPARKGRARGVGAPRARPRSRVSLPLLSPNKLFRPREASARLENVETEVAEPLPAIPEVGPGPDEGQARKERAVRVYRKRVDRGCPMVALSVQSTARSRYGFRFLCCPPITAGPGGRA